jgi:hypothetical protein
MISATADYGTELFNTALLEYTAIGGDSKIDTENRVLRDVVITAERSLNGRYYPKSTLRNAPALYEGKKVFANHSRGSGPRDVADVMGHLRNVRYREDNGTGKLVADFHYNEKHPLMERVLFAAKHQPNDYGFSHSAEGHTRRNPDGSLTVERILSVNSVDLVSDPATTKGMFESRNESFVESITGRRQPHDAPNLFNASAGDKQRPAEVTKPAVTKPAATPRPDSGARFIPIDRGQHEFRVSKPL